jgi:hypothetical protein
MDDGYPYFGLRHGQWRMRAFFYPRMCVHGWGARYGSWRDSLSAQRGHFVKDWYVFVRLGWAAWTFQIVKRVS